MSDGRRSAGAVELEVHAVGRGRPAAAPGEARALERADDAAVLVGSGPCGLLAGVDVDRQAPRVQRQRARAGDAPRRVAAGVVARVDEAAEPAALEAAERAAQRRDQSRGGTSPRRGSGRGG